jgi:multidrug efflux system outer membrane protein
VVSQQKLLNISELLYKNGTDSYLDVLTAQTGLYTAQQTLVTAQLDRATNLVSLYQALGGGWIAKTGDAPRPADLPPDWGNVDKNGTPIADSSKKSG